MEIQRKLEEENGSLKKEIEGNKKTRQDLKDEHNALNTAFSLLEKKLKDTEAENDRLVNTHTHTQMVTGHFSKH